MDRGSRGVVALAAPGMAAANPLDGTPTAAGGAVLINSIDRVLAARWEIPAVTAEELAQGGAVHQDQMDQQPTHVLILASATERAA